MLAASVRNHRHALPFRDSGCSATLSHDELLSMRMEVSGHGFTTTPAGVPRRIWFTVGGVLLAALVAFLGGLDVYLYEDGSPFAHAAYRAAPFLDLSFSLIYVTALAIGVAAMIVLARLVLAASGSAHPGVGDLVALPLLVFGAPLAFWGIALRQPGTFLSLALLLAGAVTLMLLVTRLATTRLLRLAVGHPVAAVLGACAGLVTLLLVDGGLMLAHVLVLHAAGPDLYATTMVGGSGVSELVIAFGLVAVLTCLAGFQVVRGSLTSSPAS